MTHKVEIVEEAGDDRLLHLAIPVEQPNQRYQITLYVRPVHAEAHSPAVGPGWPPGFFEQTAGSIQDETFIRHDQGKYEERIGFE